jgi:hypothetical protein
MNVSGIIVTRGDVDTAPLMETWPKKWQRIIWNNGLEEVWLQPEDGAAWTFFPVSDLGPHGRFAAIEYVAHDLCFCQDDDVIVSDPQAIVDAWVHWRDNFGKNIPYLDENPDDDPLTSEEREFLSTNVLISHVVSNMPQEFREHYPDSSLVGFGACFQRDAPERAFQRFFDYHSGMKRNDPLFLRESCRIFTVLTPRVLVDIDKQDLPYASDGTRLWRQPGHLNFRDRALRMAREVRDA